MICKYGRAIWTSILTVPFWRSAAGYTFTKAASNCLSGYASNATTTGEPIPTFAISASLMSTSARISSVSANLGDVSRASARLNLTAKIDGVPQFPVFLQDNAVDRRSDDALVHIEFGIIDGRLITFKFGLRNFRGRDRCFKVIRRNSARLDQVARPVGFVLKEMKVGFGNVSNGNGLTQLRLIVPIINARQHLTSVDVLPLLDGFFHNLSQNFCADCDVFVTGDYITRTCQQDAGLPVRPRHYHHRLHSGRPANRPSVNGVACSPKNYCKQYQDRN